MAEVSSVARLARELRFRTLEARAALAPGGMVARLFRGELEGRPLATLYVGREALARECENYFACTPEVEDLYRGSALHLWTRGPEQLPTVDVRLREQLRRGHPSSDEEIHFPFFDATLPVQATVAEQIACVRSKTHRRRLRGAARSKTLSFRLSRDRAALDLFYDRLYRPYVPARFGVNALIDDRSQLERDHRKGGRVLLVHDRGELVTGALLLERGGRQLIYHRNGFAEGTLTASPRVLADRTAALELALFRVAVEQGYSQLQLGYARALLTNGLFRHKRRIGCTFSISPVAPALRLEVLPASRPRFFFHHPHVCVRGGALIAHLGYALGERARSMRAWRSVVRGWPLPGLQHVLLHTDAPVSDRGRMAFEGALRECFSSAQLQVVDSGRASEPL